MTVLAVRFEILTAMLLKAEVFWDVMLHHGVSSFIYFKGSYCLHLQA